MFEIPHARALRIVCSRIAGSGARISRTPFGRRHSRRERVRREGGRCVKEGVDRLLLNGIDDERSAIAGNARHPGGEAAGIRHDVWADERGRGVARPQAGGEAVRPSAATRSPLRLSARCPPIAVRVWVSVTSASKQICAFRDRAAVCGDVKRSADSNMRHCRAPLPPTSRRSLT